jgi:hypothetical protein
MYLFIIQTTILSFIFICVSHSLFLYFRDTMTVPKIKDLVNAPSKQYQAMYSLISGGSSLPDIIESDLIPKLEKKKRYEE